MWSGSSSSSDTDDAVNSGAASTATTTAQRAALAGPRLPVTARAMAQIDVANEADVKAMIGQTVAWFGRIDCLVNNAAVSAPMLSIAEIDAAVASGPSAEPEAPRLPGPAARAPGSRRAAN